VQSPIRFNKAKVARSRSVFRLKQLNSFQVETSGTGVEFNGQGSETIQSSRERVSFTVPGLKYLRNTVLDARGFFPAIRPVEHQNEFGATIGGPIIKKKLFFFFSYDGWRYRVTSPTQLVSIPTLKERSGDFTELGINIYDPLTTVCVGGNWQPALSSAIRLVALPAI